MGRKSYSLRKSQLRFHLIIQAPEKMIVLTANGAQDPCEMMLYTDVPKAVIEIWCFTTAQSSGVKVAYGLLLCL